MWYIKRMFLLGHLILQVMSEDLCPPSLNNLSLIDCKDKTNVKIIRVKNTKTELEKENVLADFPRLSEVLITNASLCNIDNLFHGLKNILSIDLSDNCIDHVTNVTFQNLSNLRKLSMKYNAITNVGGDAFTSLVNLRELHLDENYIETFSSQAFATNSSLLKLGLYKNRISQVGFLRNLKELEYLDLSSNSLREVTVEDFASMTHLRYFLCSHNQISDLHFLKSASNLYYLDLQHNQIETIPVDVFNAFVNVTQISFSHNKITQINSGTFSELKQLENLDLSNNLLVYMGEILTYLPRLRSLHINNNRLKNFAFTTSGGNLMVFIDDNEWVCGFVTRLYSVKNVLLNYTFYSNVSHYNGIPCVDDVGRKEIGSRMVEVAEEVDEDPFPFYQNYVYLGLLIGGGVFVVLALVLIVLIRKFSKSLAKEERTVAYTNLARSDGGYMTPVPACQNIYEEIHDVASIRQADSCIESINSTI